MKKRWLMLMIGVPAAALCLLLLICALLQTPLAGRFALKQLHSYLHNKSGIDLQASRLRLYPFQASASIEDIAVSAVSAPELPPLFQASRIDVQSGILDMVRGRWIIRNLTIVKPVIQYHVTRDGKTNLPATDSPSGPAPDFLISHAEASDGSFNYQNLRAGISAMLPRWRLSVNGNKETRVHQILFACLRESSFNYQNRVIPVRSLELSADLRKNALRIERLQLAAADSTISVSGTLDDFPQPTADLEITPDLDIGRIAGLARLSESVRGGISGTILLQGKLDNLKIRAQLKGSDIHAFNYKGAGFDLASRVEWLRDSGKLIVRELALDSTQGSVNGSAALFPGSKPGVNLVEARIRDFDLSPLWKRLHLPVDLASRSTGPISVRWTGPFTTFGIVGNAALKLEATRTVPGLYILPVSGTLDARMQSNRIAGNVRSLSAFGSQLDGDFAIQSFRDIEGSFSGNAPDIAAVMDQLSPFVGDRVQPVGMEMAGPFHFNTQISGTLSQPKIVTSLDAPRLQAGPFRDLEVKADSCIQDAGIEFKGTIRLPLDATVTTQGKVDWRESDTTLTLDAQTDRMPAAAIPMALDNGIQINGNLSAAMHLAGKTDDLTGHATVQADDLLLYGEPMGRLDAELRFSDSTIQSTLLTLLKNPQNPATDRLEAQFAYSLDSDTFRFQAEGKGLTLNRLTLPDGSPIRGAAHLSASGTGTIQQPSIDLKVEYSDFQIGQQTLGSLSLNGTLRNEQITLDVSLPALNLSSTAYITNREPYEYRIALHAGDLDLSRLGLNLPNKQPIEGSVAAELAGSGILKDISRSQLLAQIQSLRLQVGTFTVHTRNPVRLRYRENSVEILDPVTIAGSNSTIEISGKVPVRQPAPEGTLRIRGTIDLSQASDFAPVPSGMAATGMLNLDFTLAGTARKISSEGAVTLDGGTLRIPHIPVPLTGVTLRANVRGGSMVLSQGDARWGQGRISLTGTYPFGLLPRNIPVQFPRDEGPARFALTLTDLEPELTGMLPEGVTGRVSLNASGQANGADLRSLNAQITFPELSLQANDIRFSQKEPIALAVRDGIASIIRLSINGGQGSLEASGSAGIFPKAPLDLRLVGNVDTALLTFMSQDLKAAGRMQVQISVAGNLGAPVLSGLAVMNSGRLSLRSPRVVADSLVVRLNFSPNQIAVQEFKGTLNGGSTNVSGTIGYGNGVLKDFDLKAALQDVFLNFPEGLKSVSSGNLTVTSSDDAIVIGGSLRAVESSYREPFEVGSHLMSFLREQQIVQVGQEPSPLLSRIRLDVAVRTTTPLLVQNNIARVEASANLRLVGTFYEPSMVGRITLSEGGEITLNQKSYYINRGTITLANQNVIEPDLNIQAQTKAGPYDITLQLTGMPERIVTSLTSEPPLSEADLVSLILTGKTASETRNPGAVPTQALSLIAGQAGEEVFGRGARQALHLSTFRIDPGLIASESDPGARLTLGEDITRNLSVVYSMNLVNGGDQIWAAQYDLSRRLTTQATKQQDNTYRFEFRQDLRFGGPESTRSTRSAAPKLVVGTIQFQGAGLLTEKNLLDKFKVESGDRYEFPKVQKGLDRIRDFYINQKRLEADVRLHRETGPKSIDLQLNLAPGPVIDFTFEGFPVSSEIKEQIGKAWTEGAFDTERFDGAVMAIRRPMIQGGYLQAKVAYTMETENDRKTVRFTITPGAQFPNARLAFPGASEISAAQLVKVLDQAGLTPDIHANPQKVVDYLRRYYHERGYLQARVDMPQLQLNPETGGGQVSIPIREGPLFIIGDLEFAGNRAFDYDALWSVIPTSSGSSYDPNTLRDAVRALENLYRRKGYNDAAVTFRVVQDSKASRANLLFEISERRQSVIRDIVIDGNHGTSQDFVQKQLDFKVGDTLDIGRIDETRRRLYATGVFASVDFQTEEIAGSAPNGGEKSVRVDVRLRENRPYRVQYGLFFDTERGVGGLLEVQNINFLGRASNLGLSFRYDTDLKEGRVYYNEPFVRQIHVKMDATAFVQKETRPYFSADRIGFSLFRQKELPRKYRLDYGYRYDHVRWEGLPPDPTIFQAEVPVARIIGTITRDTRDSILDPTRGEFTSHSFEFGPRFLGSEVGFTRYYGQYFRYVPLEKYLGKPIKDKEGRPLPTNLVYAGALRLGLTSAFGGKNIVSPERFFAGGGTTMRGFQQDRMGPLEALPDGTMRPLGGEALFLFNNEIRFPIVGILQGVGFLDIGNIYPKLSDFNFNLRKTAGAGLRLKIKYVPLRFDYGFKLDRRPGESRSEFFFSIGQAF